MFTDRFVRVILPSRKRRSRVASKRNAKPPTTQVNILTASESTNTLDKTLERKRNMPTTFTFSIVAAVSSVRGSAGYDYLSSRSQRGGYEIHCPDDGTSHPRQTSDDCNGGHGTCVTSLRISSRTDAGPVVTWIGVPDPNPSLRTTGYSMCRRIRTQDKVRNLQLLGVYGERTTASVSATRTR